MSRDIEHQKHYILSTERIYVFLVIPTTNNHYFRIRHSQMGLSNGGIETSLGYGLNI
jgi:hypothetical protein